MTTWYNLLTAAMKKNNDCWEDVEHSTLTPEDVTKEFNNGPGTAEGVPFAVYTINFIYFPVVYGGLEWAGSVPRNPTGLPIDHIGGE